MNQVPALPLLPALRPVLVQRRRRSASIWPDRAPPCPRRRRAMATTPASLSSRPGHGRRSPRPKHRSASPLPAAVAQPGGGGCSSGAPARERPRSSTSTSTKSRRSRRLRRSWRPRPRETWLGLGRRYLRNISRRLRRHRRSVGKGSSSSSSSMAAAVDDDTARHERAEAVARAISYCKDTLRRRPSSMPPPLPTPPPSPSPSFDDWLDDRDEVTIIATSAGEQHCDDDDCRARDEDDLRPALSPTRRPRRDDRETNRAKRFKELPCPASPSREDYGSLAATAAAVADGEESPHHGHGCRGGDLDELEFLKTFHGDEEMINRHFITVEISISGSRVFRKQSPPDMKGKRLDMKRRKIRVSVVVPTLNVFQELEN